MPGVDGVTLKWLDAAPPHARATSFAVYRVDGRVEAVGIEKAENLVATRRAEPRVQQRFVDTTADPGAVYTYAVTGLDRLWNETPPSGVRSTK